MKLLVINGPNLNLLGTREPEIYGSDTLDTINGEIRAYCEKAGISVDFFQSNSEGGIIDAIHAAKGDADGIVLNAGAYTHYSYAIRDAVSAVKIPVAEVHLSNINDREEFRSKSVLSPVCAGTIAGFGKFSYILGVQALINILGK